MSWNNYGFDATAVTIKLLVENGPSRTIASNVINSGSYSWLAGRLSSGSYITDGAYHLQVCAGTVCDASNNYFWVTTMTIPDTIALTTPNGGELWFVDSSQAIFWNANSASANVAIAFQAEGEDDLHHIATTSNDGRFDWSVGLAADGTRVTRSGRYNIWICLDDYYSNTADGQRCGVNGQPFIMQIPSLPVTVVAPNGGEVWPRGTAQVVRWTGADLNSFIRLDLFNQDLPSNDPAAVVNLFTMLNNDGDYSWTIPTTLTPGNYKMYIACHAYCYYNTPGFSDLSDASFVIE